VDGWRNVPEAGSRRLRSNPRRVTDGRSTAKPRLPTNLERDENAQMPPLWRQDLHRRHRLLLAQRSRLRRLPRPARADAARFVGWSGGFYRADADART